MAEDHEHDDALREAEQELFYDRFKPIPLSDITSGRLQPPPWLWGPADGGVDGLVRTKTISMLSAEPFTGKTMLMLSMLMSGVTASPLLGYAPFPNQNVIFLGQDAPTWDYYGIARKLWLGAGSPPIAENRALLFLNRGWRIGDPGLGTFLKSAVEHLGTNVLMIDTLLAFHSANENDNKEMAIVMDTLKAWRDVLGLTIIFSHHTSKPGQTQVSSNYRARGASVISGSVDFHLQLAARGAAVGLGLPKRRGSSKRKGTESFTITDLENGGIGLRPIAADVSPTEVLVGFLAQPRTAAELRAFVLSKFPGSTAATDGRINGVLGHLRKKGLLATLADGRLLAASSPQGATHGTEQP